MDQFEEAFTKIGEKERERLISILALLKRNKRRSFHIVFCLREEYVGHLSLLSERMIGVFSSPFHIFPLNIETAEDIVIKIFELPQHYEGPDGNSYQFNSIPLIFDKAAVKKIVTRSKLGSTDDNFVNTFFLQLFCRDIEQTFCQDREETTTITIQEKDIPDKWFSTTRSNFIKNAIQTIPDTQVPQCI